MPKYRVTYETTVKPEDLPSGAVVEELSVLPLVIGDGIHRTRISVDANTNPYAAVIRVSDRQNTIPRYLDAEQVRQVIEALTTTLPNNGAQVGDVLDGDTEPPENVLKVRDEDGDILARHSNGGWCWSELSGVTYPESQVYSRAWAYFQTQGDVRVVEVR